MRDSADGEILQHSQVRGAVYYFLNIEREMEEPGYGRALNMYFIPLQPSHRLCESLLMFASPSLRRHAGGAGAGPFLMPPPSPPVWVAQGFKSERVSHAHRGHKHEPDELISCSKVPH